MKRFLTVLFALNMMLEAVCCVTTSYAENSINGRQEICLISQGTVGDR